MNNEGPQLYLNGTVKKNREKKRNILLLRDKNFILILGHFMPEGHVPPIFKASLPFQYYPFPVLNPVHKTC